MILRRPACLFVLGLSWAAAEGARAAEPAAPAPRRATATTARAGASTAPNAATMAVPSASRLVADHLAGRRIDDAVAALKDSAAANPASASEAAATLLLVDRSDEAVELLLAAGRNAEAIDVLLAAMRVSEALAVPAEAADADAQLARARALSLAGRDDEAAMLLGALVEGPHALRALRQAGVLGLGERFLGDALDVAAGASRAVERSLPGALWPARRLEAEAAWHWLRRGPDASDAAESLLRIRAMLDPAQPSRDAEEMLAAGAAAIAPTPSACEQPRLFAGLVGLAERRDRPDAALAIAREWAGQGEAAGWMTLGDLLRQRQDWAAAAAAYGEAARLAPRDAAARWLQGEMLRRGGLEGAAGLLAAAETTASDACGRGRLAQVMEMTGAAAGAERMRHELIEKGAPASQLAATAASLGRGASPSAWEAALRGARHARLSAARSSLSVAQVLPIVRQAKAAEARGLVRAGKGDEALALSLRAPEAFVLDVDATADLVALLRQADRSGDAEDLLARVSDRVARSAEDHPESPRLLNARAWLAARTGADLQAAREAAERAVELAPHDAGILDTLAEVRFQQGEHAAALEAAQAALALDPNRAYLKHQVQRISQGNPSAPLPAVD